MGLFDEKDGDLVAFWAGVTEITDIVGAGDNCKIWPDEARQDLDPPYIVYEGGNGGESHQHLAGYTGLRESIVHAFCYGSKRSIADNLAEVVKAHTQVLQEQTIGGTWIDHVRSSPIFRGYDKATDQSTNRRYWSRVVFNIVHSERTGP